MKIQNKEVEFSFRSLFKKTPKIIRRIGIALSSAGLAGAGLAYIGDYPKLAGVCVIAVIVGTFVGNMFSYK